MRHIVTSLDIDAYPEWNPHVTAATGPLREGGEVTLTVVSGGRRPRTIRATVTALEPLCRLEWVGVAGSRLLFEGRHAFTLSPLPGGRTRLGNREDRSGLLVSLVVRPDAHRDYEAMNEALATRVAAPTGARVTGETTRAAADRTADGTGDRERPE